MATKKKITLVGCGWLGLPLGQHLVQKGYQVKGSTTSLIKIPLILQANIEPFLVHLNPALSGDRLNDFFDSDLIIINIPPKGDYSNYVKKAIELRNAIVRNGIKEVLFISSTSVYAEDNFAVNESTVAKPDSYGGKAVLDAENIFRYAGEFHTTIIRFAGLIGPARHPARFFSGKKGITNGKAPINLIHLDDCIGIITHILEKDDREAIYNGCSLTHPEKQLFYTTAATQASLPTPEFIDELASWKLVNSLNLLNSNYQYQHPDLLAWLNELPLLTTF